MRTSKRTRASCTRAITGTAAMRRRAASSSAEPGPRSATTQDASSKPGSEPPPTSVLSGSTDTSAAAPQALASRSASARARASSRGSGLEELAQHRDLALRAAGEQGRERPVERGERQLVEPQRARHRIAPQRVDETRPAEHDARLRSPEQLVAREAHEVGAQTQARRSVGFRRQTLRREIDERAAAEILDQRHAVRAAELRQLGQRHLGDEAAQLEVAAVDLEQQRGARAERSLVVGQVRAVRGADLDQLDPRPFEDFRHPERAADLDQLAARDDHLPAARERRRAPGTARQRCC